MEEQDLEVHFSGSQVIYHERSESFHMKIQGIAGEMKDEESEPQHEALVFIQVIGVRLYSRLNCI